MKLYYENRLKPLAKTLRKAGNLSEVILWNEVKKNKLGCRFLRQRPIGRYIADFYCHSLKLVIEIDGAASHNYKVEKDYERQKNMESLGIRVMRFTDADIRYGLEGVIMAIKAEILRLADSPPPFKKEE